MELVKANSTDVGYRLQEVSPSKYYGANSGISFSIKDCPVIQPSKKKLLMEGILSNNSGTKTDKEHCTAWAMALAPARRVCTIREAQSKTSEIDPAFDGGGM
jgi:hypothetical protein